MLRALLTDLEIRARLGAEALRDAPAAGGRSSSLASKMDYIAGEARQLLEADLEGAPESFYPNYQSLSATLFEHETFEVPFMVLHDRAAERATRLCAELLADVRWPYESILVSPFSTQYYWTIAPRRVIAIPCGEERRLLGVPDLCHEIGHSVYWRADRELVGDFPRVLRDHLGAALDPQAQPPDWSSRPRLTEVFLTWAEAWLQEFVCDLVATYLLGPAYLWQHARLRTLAAPSSSLFALELGASHPADDARMRACLALLRRSGSEAEASEIEARWAEVIALAGESAPPGYEVAYGESLLGELVERVIAGCGGIGLRALDPYAEPGEDLPQLVNEAWRRLLAEPEAYEEWERSTLADLWSGWGL